MKKKLLILLLSFTLFACASTTEESEITITIPADYLSSQITQEQADKEKEENGYQSATVNEDGSITYVMSKEVHEKMMTSIQSKFVSTIDSMKTNEKYTNIKDITYNDDFTEFTVSLKGSTYNSDEEYTTVLFYVMGQYYNAFNNKEVNDITVTFVNSNTNETVKEKHLSDLNKEKSEA